MRDVTDWNVFTSSDSSSVGIDAEAKTAQVLRRGRHIIMARYLSQVLPIEVLMPLRDSEQKITYRNDPERGFVDDAILQTLATLNLPTSPQVDDGTFLRRVTLDLTGRLPTVDRVKSFTADSRSNKGERLIDELLQSEEFTQYWTLQFARLLRIGAKGEEGAKLMAEKVYHQWLADQIRNNVSYKEIVGKLITATGDSNQKGEANFYRTTPGPREQAEFFSELFMGSRMRCANCHNHPLDRWTQDDYHGLAAIFAKVEMAAVVKERSAGKVIHPRTLEEAVQRIPGKDYLPSDAADGREELANWLTDQSNPYFAKAAVNRLWQRLMGRGLVEPVDDFRSTNPATHPALLEQLANDFIASGFDLLHSLRTIAKSDAYARSANATPENKDDDRFYSHALRRPLEPEVLADAISDVLGVASKYGDQPIGTRAVAVIDPVAESRTLDVLGRCGRNESCESSSSTVGGLPQKLHLFNGNLLNARISADESRLRSLLASGKSPTEIVREFYLLALGRTPSVEEEGRWQNMLSQASSKTSQLEFLEDFVWGLLVSEEFTTNH